MQRRTQAIMQRRSRRDPGNEVAHNARRSGGNWPASPSGRVQYHMLLVISCYRNWHCWVSLVQNVFYWNIMLLTSSRGIWDTPQLFGQLRGNRRHTWRWLWKKIIKINFTLQTSTKTGQLLGWLERRQGCQLIDIIVRPQAAFLFH